MQLLLDHRTLPIEARNALIRENPAYGTVICRCESITEGEILDAIHRTPGARSIDGIKRRTRAGMGRCQGGFCSPRVLEILSRELGIPPEEVILRAVEISAPVSIGQVVLSNAAGTGVDVIATKTVPKQS